ncbi:hypothetical protein T4D_7829 [Trichinella pseudospiralis]|uniref:Uncharacterized protein n=1 Tax=Trichinella pseudospiralis TaxID=6337 RepID=A0A0V1DQ86_TRIPS|nr:hypothetical protein T4D_7829 [Trichinella pseudospiralis]
MLAMYYHCQRKVQRQFIPELLNSLKSNFSKHQNSSIESGQNWY